MTDRSQLAELWDEPPPQNGDLEREVLACLAQFTGHVESEQFLRFAYGALEAADFASEPHARLYLSLRKAWTDGVPVGSRGLVAAFLAEEERQGSGFKAADLAELIQSLPSMPYARNLPWAWRTLRRLRLEREARQLAWEIARHAHGLSPSVWSRQAADAIAEFGRLVADAEAILAKSP